MICVWYGFSTILTILLILSVSLRIARISDHANISSIKKFNYRTQNVSSLTDQCPSPSSVNARCRFQISTSNLCKLHAGPNHLVCRRLKVMFKLNTEKLSVLQEVNVKTAFSVELCTWFCTAKHIWAEGNFKLKQNFKIFKTRHLLIFVRQNKFQAQTWASWIDFQIHPTGTIIYIKSSQPNY